MLRNAITDCLNVNRVRFTFTSYRSTAYGKANSGWAEEHPLQFTVHRLNRTTFQVQLYGLPEEDAPAKMRQSTDKAWKEITAAQMDTPAPQQ